MNTNDHIHNISIKGKALSHADRVSISHFVAQTIIFLLTIIAVLGLATKQISTTTFLTAAGFVLTMVLITYFLSKNSKGSIEATLLTCILLTAATVYSLGSILVPTTAVFLVLIILSAILLGNRGIILSTTLSILLVFALTYAEINHLIIPTVKHAGYFQFTVYTLFFVFTAFIALFIVRQFQQFNADLIMLTQVVEQSPISIVITDLAGTIEYVNAGFSNVTGYSFTEALGKNPNILSSKTKTKEEYEQLWQTIRSGKNWHGEFTNIKKDGTLYYESSVIGPIMDDQNNITKYVAMKEDITLRKQAEAELRETNRTLALQLQEIELLQKELKAQALHDPLTGLYNRRYLNEMLDKEFNRVLRADGHLSLVVMDIDLFKNVNDTFGHKTGDYVLIAIAKYLESSVRVSDFCCRYGGEEFVLVMPTASIEIAAERAENLRKTLEDLQFNDGEKQIRLTASFGIATYPHHAQNIDDLLSRADQALYLSKQSGRNKVTTWQ